MLNAIRCFNRNRYQQHIAPLNIAVFPYYQPIVEVASGRIDSYEALARKKDHQGQVVSAGRLFIDPDISASNKRRLDHRVRRQALESVHQLPSDTRIAINISPEWINHLGPESVVPTLEMVDEVGIDPSRVTIELTEDLGDIDRISAVVRRYRQAGMEVAIDDFGTGFSQLDRVIALEPDVIKLDMQLFKQAVKGGLAEKLVRSLVEFSTKSGGRIVCEGVETEEEFFFGLHCGARYMQGFLFAAAGPYFLQPDTFSGQLKSLRKKYFDSMERRESQKVERIGTIKQKVQELRNILLAGCRVDVERLVRQYRGIPELIRFYICNRRGDQVTANYEYYHIDQTWHADSSSVGFNWSWRPYFYQLMVLDSQQQGRLVASDCYQDRISGRPCKTLAMMLQDEQVLLVDVVADW
ncbi:MAG: EAL domain-containing protein [Motiliproteus sp.]|nr:EAL domain-containing protein [Motiliproteus sp.]MCW9050956.1 EAL domain-containing protein [Motiliproteus sp.]